MMHFWWSPQSSAASSSLPGLSIFPPGNDFQSSSTVNHFLSFSCHFQLLVVKCLCWQCMVVPAEWKKGFRKLYHLCPARPNPNRQFSMLQRSHGFTEHLIQKPNRTEIVRSQGWKVLKRCRIFLLRVSMCGLGNLSEGFRSSHCSPTELLPSFLCSTHDLNAPLSTLI